MHAGRSYVSAGLVWLVGFLTSSSTTRLYRGRAPRQSVWQFYVLPNMRQSWETMTSVSAGHIILTPTQPVGSGRPHGNRTRDLLTRSRALYRLSYRAPLCQCSEAHEIKFKKIIFLMKLPNKSRAQLEIIGFFFNPKLTDVSAGRVFA